MGDIVRIVFLDGSATLYFGRLGTAWERSMRLRRSHTVEAKAADGRWMIVSTVALAEALMDAGVPQELRKYEGEYN